ncbi:MAG: tyramine oxidase [Rhodospirillaceae bacterium]|nr:tyramine oxidase [Rhodospirillaceae bacterium]|tara:strand:+ start:501 stop:2420 length:1920 start_codon:yes stop_codon:yes gene_type:complete
MKAHNSVQNIKLTHPLQPLTPYEIEKVVQIVKTSKCVPDGLVFEIIELKEPPKSVVRIFSHGDKIKREARVNMFPQDDIGVYQIIVNLDKEEIMSLEHNSSARPMIQLEQFMKIEETVKSSPEFIQACKKRGITDMDEVCVDPWSAGVFEVEGEGGRHLSHTFSWQKVNGAENYYAHPIEGLNAVVDINSWEVIRVDDYGAVPIPQKKFEYTAASQKTTREDLLPINIEQPEGVSFELNGHELSWHEWELVVGFNARESLTLHNIKYAGRPVLYRASVAEMVVPYGSPDGGHFRKNVFDIGEYGIGYLTNSLKLGCDCLGSIQYLDAWTGNMNGGLIHTENAICIHEEDNGILWKHWDFRSDDAEVRRSRRLVISSIVTVGNYEYGFYWYLYLDGVIEFEIKATGSINTTACVPGEPSKFGREVAPGVVGQIHQHFFCARLDMSIDGDENSVVESNTKAEDSLTNPYGNAFFEEETLLSLETGRIANPSTQRYWKFINPNKHNHVGKPTAYKLEPKSCITPFINPESPSGKRSSFINNHLWLSAYDPEERFPAGNFVNHSEGCDGISAYVAQERSIDNTDLVAWHIFGLHHQPRTEDFPIQSCVTCGFSLMPAGFFDTNPCLDLPSSYNLASCHANSSK